MSTSIPQVQNEVALTEITPENWEHYDTVYIGYPMGHRCMAGQPVRHRQGRDPPSVPLSVPDRVKSDALLSEAAGTGA